MVLPPLRLQTRTLVLAIAAALVPFALLAVGVVTQVRPSLLEKAQADHVALLTRVSLSLQANVDRLMHQLELLCQDERLQSMRFERIHQAVYGFLKVQDSFNSLFVYDRQRLLHYAEYRSHSTRDEVSIGSSVAGSKFAGVLDLVFTTSKCASFDYLTKDATHSNLLLVVPIPTFTGVGPPVGALSGSIQMYSHEFQALIDDLRLEGSTYCLILDRRNRTLARRGTGVPLHVSSVELPQEILEGKKGTTTWMRVGDRTDLVTVTSLPQAGSTIVVGRPATEVLALLDRLTYRILVVALVGIILAVGCALALSRSLAHPILLLTEGIRKVGEGATGHRVQIEGDDELGRAGEAFNRMAAQLQKGKLMEQIWSREWGVSPSKPEIEPPGGGAHT